MRTPLVVAFLAIVLIAVLVVWRSMGGQTPVTLSNAKVQAESGAEGTAMATLKIEAGAAPDVLLSASSPEAEAVAIVSPTGATRLTIPAGSAPSLSSDGAFLRLSGVDGALEEGRLIPLTLEFARSGKMSVQARVGAEVDPHAMHRAMAAMAEAGGDGPPPALSMVLEPAADGATRVRLTVENFTFDREAAEVETPVHVPGRGHGHLYLDGLKLQRVYAPELTIGALPEGAYTVRVELNSNNHMPYRDEAGPVAAEAVLEVE
ncbi:copper chaperone PCu(A)C [Roseovarius faecimaris]|uniref:Copper chaperone PCu(A)C n=1 Tax=Roseovarius faecimaris TaxID=2494550 RepID=A0A6I6J5F2_9RHOB|nr:copper chaperone PCu(A)C [Roseovarius faecimaris]QGX99988.1 copper chaperone PCu(A)C [Roseovarius faecimaris]